ncbi:hypothetical protein DAPPUDRAFT_95969 [Daphnia pulex]|uniref:Uncharacterized protein n=1 Tax=Daphnia pulex TaxID=6669 RepID=E9FWI2_DAPPU|nr:hypothetical protein DAPPUDRAFT_95969 [Daphnia pulex]|eukprot:EFX88429.1 hypothetical protein DAPPUDRAFT_95969 [Daphnia pulex]
MRKKLEFQTVEELEGLLRQRRTHWKTQAIFTCLRISKECDCFPNRFVVYNLFKFALEGWGKRKLPRHRAFAVSLHLFELFGHTEFLDQLVKNVTDLEDVVHLTFTEFFNTLRDLQRNQLDITKPDTVLTFDDLMTSLVFSFVYQVKVHDGARIDQIKIKDYTIKSKADKLEEISELILVILKLLVSIPKSKTQSKKLKSLLAIYINIYELKRANQKPNLLLKVCTTHQGKPNEFKLIKLLLKAGADPNAVDQQRCSPLHLLANSELSYSHMWGDLSYSTRAEYFTSIVRVILDGRFHEDQMHRPTMCKHQCYEFRFWGQWIWRWLLLLAFCEVLISVWNNSSGLWGILIHNQAGRPVYPDRMSFSLEGQEKHYVKLACCGGVEVGPIPQPAEEKASLHFLQSKVTEIIR